MVEWASIGKLFIGIGAVMAVLGVLFLLADRVPGIGSLFGWFGKLPGDISIKRDNFSLFFPLGTSLLLSVVLSLLFYLVSWIFRR
ncbi:MAG TPA: DUF2905 domain-containing protein [Nitrospira sp.]|nr:DUF2905 domain-containing protein [Nitrospira sp.]